VDSVLEEVRANLKPKLSEKIYDQVLYIFFKNQARAVCNETKRLIDNDATANQSNMRAVHVGVIVRKLGLMCLQSNASGKEIFIVTRDVVEEVKTHIKNKTLAAANVTDAEKDAVIELMNGCTNKFGKKLKAQRAKLRSAVQSKHMTPEFCKNELKEFEANIQKKAMKGARDLKYDKASPVMALIGKSATTLSLMNTNASELSVTDVEDEDHYKEGQDLFKSMEVDRTNTSALFDDEAQELKKKDLRGESAALYGRQ
jgi:hypothetical protein